MTLMSIILQICGFFDRQMAFPLNCEDFGEGSTIYSLFSFDKEINWCTAVSIFRPESVHSGSAS